MSKLSARHLTIGAFLASSALSAPAYAQFIPPADVPPVHSRADQFGVDLVTRKIAAQVWGSISIGPGGPGSLAFISSSSNRTGTVLNTGLDISGSKYSVYSGGATSAFTLNGTLGTGTFSNDQAGGETLTYSSATGQYTFTAADGTVLVIGISGVPRPVSIVYPAGETVSWNYDTSGSSPVLRSVTTNLGYQYRSVLADPNNPNLGYSKFVLFNMANETCDPLAVSCTLTNTWPTMDYVAVTVNGNPMVSWSSQTDGSCSGCTIITKTVPVTSTTNRALVYKVDADSRVTSVTDGKGTWNYSYSPGGGATFTDLVDGGISRRVRVAAWDTTTGLVSGDYIIANGGVNGSDSTLYTYDSNQRIQTVMNNGVKTTYTYGARSNISQTVTQDTAGNTTNQIATSAAFPTSCANMKTCNQPTSTTDANGNVTSYSYDATTGGVSTISYPAVGGIVPKTTYTYASQSVTWNGGSASGIYRPTKVSRCSTNASCTNTADEVRTTLAYGTAPGLLASSVTSQSGDGTLAAATTYTYTTVGDTQTIDGPLSGTADTSWFAYDADRRLIGTIGPAPGNGQSNRAISVSYNLAGQIDTTSMGTATAQSTAALNAMTVLQKAQPHYDAQGRKDKDTIYDNAAVIAGVSQYNYTTVGNLQCVAVRNSSTTWNSQPDACAQTSTAKDLITKYKTDDLGHVLEVRNGYTSDSQTPDLINSYNPVFLQTQQDGNGKTTSYSYDTFNRLSSTCYPDTAVTTGASSTTDCETIPQYYSDGSIQTRVLRGGTTISYTYDPLNRLKTKALPEGTVTYGYDLLGHLKSVAQGTTTLTYNYDQLGRNTDQISPLGTVHSDWNLDGTRQKLTYPDNSYVNYDYLVTGDLQKIHENGATTGVGVLATYVYDALGNRSSVTYGNGAVQTYTYDSLYRLWKLNSNLEGAATTNDVLNTLGYNPASQVTSLAHSNDKYAWARSSASYTYSANPLNQYTSNGTTSFSYDARGNLSKSGSTYYCYSSEKRLLKVGTTATCGSPTATLSYDPAGRLSKVVGTLTTQFVYDGLNMLAEYDAAATPNLKARYVFGPRVDEPIVAYNSAGTRTFLTADESGSIIALTNSAGTVTATNAYDEYGMPKSDTSGVNVNTGRFQYTGQAWLGEIGLQYSKNRLYSPTLGRFLQIDPIGYGDGTNMYAYAHNDPVNGSDPLGLDDGVNCGSTGVTLWCRVALPQGDDTGSSSDLGFGFSWGGIINFGGRVAYDYMPPWVRNPTPPEAAQTCPSHPILGALGKLNGAINTAIGLGAAAGSAALGSLKGYAPQVHFRNNAIQVTNAATIGGRAYTIGNVQVYSPGGGPNVSQPSYSGAIVQNGPHEEGHTVQSQILGVLYLPAELVGSLAGDSNPLEIGADKYGLGLSCSGF